MGSLLRTNSSRILALALLLTVGSVVRPAADPVSAAGLSGRPPVVDGPGGDDGLTAPADVGDYLIYIPLIMRRWPPVPYSPALVAVEDVVWDAPIRLDWQADVPLSAYPIEAYVLEESATSGFAEASSYAVPTTTVPYTLPALPYGSHGWNYYRVRGDNVWGAGEWSNTVAALLLSEMYSFDHPQSGWAPRRTSYWDLGAMYAEYGDGLLVTRVEDKFDFAVFSPMRPAPAPPYALRMNTKILHKANETSYGIVFGGNEGDFCGVNRWSAEDPDGCFFHYYRLNVIWGGYLKWGIARIDYHEGIAGGGSGVVGSMGGYSALDWYEADADGWNEWEIRVYTNGFEIYVNGHLIGATGDTTYLNEPHYGIFSSTYEYNSARFRHEYFYVEPLSGAATMSTTPTVDLIPVDLVTE